MIGYGPEEENFALELTYNYGIDAYKNGNDLQYICLQLDVEDTKAKAEAEGEDRGESVSTQELCRLNVRFFTDVIQLAHYGTSSVGRLLVDR